MDRCYVPHTVFCDVHGETQVFFEPHPAHVVPVRVASHVNALVRAELLYKEGSRRGMAFVKNINTEAVKSMM